MSTAFAIQPDPSDAPRPCSECMRLPATVYLRSASFASAVCDADANVQIARVARAGGTYTLDRVVGVPAITTIGGITLADYAREVLDGVTGDCNLAAMQTVPGAQAEIARALLDRLRRALSPSELLGAHEAARTEVVARWKSKREGMLETERRLHAPFGSGLRQRIG